MATDTRGEEQGLSPSLSGVTLPVAADEDNVPSQGARVGRSHRSLFTRETL